MICGECKHFTMRTTLTDPAMRTVKEMAALNFGRCTSQTVPDSSSLFRSMVYERTCLSFEKVDADEMEVRKNYMKKQEEKFFQLGLQLRR